jgi:hypothetical protein
VPALNDLAERSYDANNLYGDLVHIVHVYVIEPHPQSPDISPYRGEVWEANYSSKPQPYTYAARVANAQDSAALLQGEQLLLVDDLDNDGLINPVWCTYGPCPNCGFLIGQDGVVQSSQQWIDAESMRIEIDWLLTNQ